MMVIVVRVKIGRRAVSAGSAVSCRFGRRTALEALLLYIIIISRMTINGVDWMQYGALGVGLVNVMMMMVMGGKQGRCRC